MVSSKGCACFILLTIWNLHSVTSLSQTISNDYFLQWVIEKDIITFTVTVKTLGSVGIGFNDIPSINHAELVVAGVKFQPTTQLPSTTTTTSPTTITPTTTTTSPTTITPPVTTTTSPTTTRNPSSSTTQDTTENPGPTEETTEPTTMPTSGSTDPITDPASGSTDPITDPASGSTDPITDPASGSTEPITDPASGSTDPITDPASGSTEPITDPASGSTEPVTDPASGSTEPITDPASGSTEPITDPASGSTEPVTDPASGSTDPITDPISGSINPETDKENEKIFRSMRSLPLNMPNPKQTDQTEYFTIYKDGLTYTESEYEKISVVENNLGETIVKFSRNITTENEDDIQFGDRQIYLMWYIGQADVEGPIHSSLWRSAQINLLYSSSGTSVTASIAVVIMSLSLISNFF